MSRPGRPEKYLPDQWEQCRRLMRRGWTPRDIEPLVGIPTATIYHRRWVETQAGTHDWGSAPTRKGPKRRYPRRCWHCQQLAEHVTLDEPCPHCGYSWRMAA